MCTKVNKGRKMEQFTDENLYFHINVERPYSHFKSMNKDDEIDIGSSFNPLFQIFLDNAESLNILHTSESIEETDIQILYGYLQSIKSKDFNIIKMEELTRIANKCNKDDSLGIFCREVFLEKFRQHFFPNLPSRLNCIWVIKSQDEAEHWVSVLDDIKNITRVVRLSLDGNTHKADGMLLPLTKDEFEIWLVKAKLYWSGQFSANPMVETLFTGKAKVTEVWELERQVIPLAK